GGPRCSPPNPPCHADRNQQRDVAHLAGLAGAGIATRGAALIALRIAQPIRLGIEQGVQRLLHDAPHHPVEVALDPIVAATTAQSPANGLHPTRSPKPQIAQSEHRSSAPTANYATEAAFCLLQFMAGVSISLGDQSFDSLGRKIDLSRCQFFWKGLALDAGDVESHALLVLY